MKKAETPQKRPTVAKAVGLAAIVAAAAAILHKKRKTSTAKQ